MKKESTANKKKDKSKLDMFLNKYGTAIVWIVAVYMVAMIILAFIFGLRHNNGGGQDEPEPTMATETAVISDETTITPAVDVTSFPAETEDEPKVIEETETTIPEETPVTEEIPDEPTEVIEPASDSVTIWVNLETLTIRHDPSLTSGALGKIPYGTEMTGEVVGRWKDAQGDPNAEAWEVCDKWLHITYEGVEGYIFMGTTKGGRNCVVYSKDDLEPR